MNQDHAYIHREWHRAASMRDLPALLALYADDATLTDTDIISAQHCWTGGLETAGPGCYDAVAIAGRRVSECWL